MTISDFLAIIKHADGFIPDSIVDSLILAAPHMKDADRAEAAVMIENIEKKERSALEENITALQTLIHTIKRERRSAKEEAEDDSALPSFDEA